MKGGVVHISASIIVYNCACQLCVVFAGTRQRTVKKRPKKSKNPSRLNARQPKPTLVELRQEFHELQNDRDILDAIIDEVREAVIGQEKRIQELQYEVRYLH